MTNMRWALWVLGLLLPLSSQGAEVYDRLPDSIHTSESYVIFSHGRIAEGAEPRPVSPQFGVYDFPSIKQALAQGSHFNLIAQQRPKSDDDAYADVLVSWVKRLLAAGVAPNRITLVGFSRGARLTGLAAGRLVGAGINTVLLAICENGDFENDPPVTLGGSFLSIYEKSDEYGSCSKLAARSRLNSFQEIAISTGRRHAAFFQPSPDWVVPLKAWIEKQGAQLPVATDVQRQ